ncbi:SAM-dependent methyltransferase [Sphingomonas sp. RHCKR7]|uniref:HsdM family class I SAM-dependent methyltransferase n=1 Tax=Sphingomonas folli TaxID=2862497 RepID=UPI001C680CB2|nr:N-6 DNA methylase [Sphingomonas folli]MBW6528195.1 SAM-dependent methyltransferase [Sphingomonas folli]
MSEELKQRGLEKGGEPYGPLEYLNIGATTLGALKAAKLIPPRDYTGFENRKPDALIVDQRSGKPRVVAVIEFKDNLRRDDGIAQAATVAAALGAKFAISSDTVASFWFLPAELGQYNPIRRADGTILNTPFLSPGHQDQARVDAARILVESLDERLDGDVLPERRSLNPSGLARSVWQDIYTAGNTPSPAQALSTFVEIFMFKYLSDLGILTTDDNGTEISFEAVLAKPAEQCLRYYRANVRDRIRDKFPSSQVDRTTLVNGFALNPGNSDHNYVFKSILTKFKEYELSEDGGKFIHIDKEFKSRLFEDFLKGSVGQRSLGQFFTPRRLMKGIVDMADVESLPAGSVIADPACGVGGFPLEAAARRAARLNRPEFSLSVERRREGRRTVEHPKVTSDIEYRGFDKGSDRLDENLAIILAKANFVIYQSDLLVEHPNATRAMAECFNEVFQAYTETSLGSLSEINEDAYHLVLSNPPYLNSGAGSIKDAARRAGLSYTAGGSGLEGLFVEKIVRELAPNGRAFIILPDGVFLRSADARLRAWVAERCSIDGIISLPVKTFYAVKKKTYVLCITRKSEPGAGQNHPVFAYLVGSFGESLDGMRFPTHETDMPELARLYRSFISVKGRFAEDPEAGSHLSSPKVKLIPAADVLTSGSWSVDRFWTPEEKVALGIHEELTTITEEEFFDSVRAVYVELGDLISGIDDAE